LYTAQKSNSHYAPQPYTNHSVFKSLLNCASEMSLSRNATGRGFQRHGPATEKLLSPRRVRVLYVAHVKTSADRSDRRPMSVKSWQSSARYCGSWPCNALWTRTASLTSMRLTYALRQLIRCPYSINVCFLQPRTVELQSVALSRLHVTN